MVIGSTISDALPCQRRAAATPFAARETMPAPPLNVFQRLIQQWDAIHPYNAAQVMLVTHPVDAATADSTWRETLADLQVGAIPVRVQRHLDAAPLSAATALPPLVQALDPNESSIDSHLSAELNRPFDPSGETPFRPFVLPHESGSRAYIGIVYQHRMADSVSVRTVLREWFFRMYHPTRARRSPLRVARGGYWTRFGPWRSSWPLIPTALHSLSWATRLKKVRRVESKHFAQPQVRFALHQLPEGTLGGLIDYARWKHVTLNDVFLAAIARVCDRYVVGKANDRRYNLKLATIVDLRATARPPIPDDEFGLFLGFTGVLLRPRDMRDWDTLLRSIALQNVRNKQAHAAESSQLRMAGALIIGRLLKPDQLMAFYRKRFPLAAGISNVNLNRTWVAEHAGRDIVDYFRVSPTGPIMPLVFTPSTLGDTLNFGMTYRESVISPDLAATIAGEFAGQLVALAGAK